jgi:hypothetical protein
MAWIVRVFSILGFLFLSELLQAQSTWIKGGVNYSTVTDFSGKSGNELQVGLNCGLAKDIVVSKTVNFQSGIFYSLQGNQTAVSRIRYHYLQIPLHVDFHVEPGKFGFLVGPQFSVLSRATMNFDDGPMGSVLPLARAFDLSLAAGPYFELTDKLRLEFRTMVGLTNIAIDPDDKAVHLVFQACLAWSIKSTQTE